MVLCGGIVGHFGAKANALLPLVLLVMVLGSAAVSLAATEEDVKASCSQEV